MCFFIFIAEGLNVLANPSACKTTLFQSFYFSGRISFAIIIMVNPQ